MSETPWAERIEAAVVEGLSRRALAVDGGEVIEVDGLVVALTNLSDPSINGVCVVSEPADPDAALASAEEEFRRRGHAFFGIELERGRHPELEEAVKRAGLALLFSHPALAVRTADLVPPTSSEDVDIARVVDGAGLAEMRAVDLEAFGGDPTVTERFLGAGMIASEQNRSFLARSGERAVGAGTGWLLRGTVGIFGIAVVERARRRGIGAALTLRAAHAFGDAPDLAWLHPSEMARSLYETLGFRAVSEWDIWVRPDPQA
jgi:ribosomal protein S18 acetylase RimI-like enzyme